jgi:S-adenosylmethionine uptake transporter
MTPAVPPATDNLRGGAWLIADFALNIWALSIVKALGAEYPSFQIVFLRAGVGFLLIVPLIWLQRRHFRAIPDLHLHLVRVGLSSVALTASFYAIARVPLAVFTAVGFTRPLVTMVLAAVLLREVIGPRRWAAAGLALVGVLIAVNPGMVEPSMGLAALGLVVLTAAGVVIATRRLRAAPAVVMMAFYTVGLTLFTAPFAVLGWVPLAPGHLLPLLAVGVFAQVAQICFLRAHFFGEAGFLSVLSYLSLLFSAGVGYFVFDEVPTLSFALGACLVIAAALWVTVEAGRGRRA